MPGLLLETPGPVGPRGLAAFPILMGEAGFSP